MKIRKPTTHQIKLLERFGIDNCRIAWEQNRSYGEGPTMMAIASGIPQRSVSAAANAYEAHLLRPEFRAIPIDEFGDACVSDMWNDTRDGAESEAREYLASGEYPAVIIEVRVYTPNETDPDNPSFEDITLKCLGDEHAIAAGGWYVNL